jgi:hypothetical protein
MRGSRRGRSHVGVLPPAQRPDAVGELSCSPPVSKGTLVRDRGPLDGVVDKIAGLCSMGARADG